jgi:hypothetical protein
MKDTVVPLIHGFISHGSSYLLSTKVQNINWKIPEINSEDCEEISCHSVLDVVRAFVQHIHAACDTNRTVTS